jgi:hypothetical protein
MTVLAARYAERTSERPYCMRRLVNRVFWSMVQGLAGLLCLLVLITFPIVPQHWSLDIVSLWGVVIAMMAGIAPFAMCLMVFQAYRAHAGLPGRVVLEAEQLHLEGKRTTESFPVADCRWRIGKACECLPGMGLGKWDVIIILCGSRIVLCGFTEEARTRWSECLTRAEATVLKEPSYARLCATVALGAILGKIVLAACAVVRDGDLLNLEMAGIVGGLIGGFVGAHAYRFIGS